MHLKIVKVYGCQQKWNILCLTSNNPPYKAILSDQTLRINNINPLTRKFDENPLLRTEHSVCQSHTQRALGFIDFEVSSKKSLPFIMLSL